MHKIKNWSLLFVMFYPIHTCITKIRLNSLGENNSASAFHEISLNDIDVFICCNELPKCHAIIQHGSAFFGQNLKYFRLTYRIHVHCIQSTTVF